MNEIPHFDIQGVLERLDGDRELLVELRDVFVETKEGSLKAIFEAIEANDPARISSTAHAIKGALGNVGAAQAHTIAYSLEKSGKSGSIEGVRELYQALVQEIEAYLREFAEVMGA